jgi:23S rRNA (cytosine1962-C5)-methyltransferase
LFDEHTTGFRCIHGEADGWPGLVLDRYDTTLVLKLYTAAWLPRLKELVGLIGQCLKPERVVLRLSRNIQALAKARFRRLDGELASVTVAEEAAAEVPTDAAPVPFLESGLRFEADVLRGQKTGFFLDQRENRRIVESLARGRDVLNAFSFTGGFSVYAAHGGARSVTDLDISQYALAGSRRNFALNSAIAAVAACRHETLQADAFEWLERGSRSRFDLIVLDPPSLARSERGRGGAIQAYRKLAGGGIRRLRPRGILVAASCSAHVSADEFFDAVREAARQSRRAFTVLQTTGHGPDHPATFEEMRYLKCIYLKF